MKKLVLLLSIFMLTGNALADVQDKTVLRQGTVTQDLYAWGERVRVDAKVDGDVVVAGGKILVDGSVSGDVMAVGGELNITAELADDIRSAGGQINLCSQVSGDAVIAGGEVTLCADAVVGENAWLAGGEVTVDGRIEQNLNIKGGKIIIAAEILRDVDLEANSIEILPGAVIHGKLDYQSPNAATIHEGAQIAGGINHSQTDSWWTRDRSMWDAGDVARAGAVFLLIGVVATTITALLLAAIFPDTRINLTETIRGRFLNCLITGLIALLLTPLVVILLAMTVIGLPIAGILILLYILLIVAGYFTVVLMVADQFYRWIKQDQPTTTFWHVLTVFLAALTISIISVIPLLGGLIMFIAYLTGIGAVCLHLQDLRKTPVTPGL